ncbi:hypothetical protein B0W48_13650 [Pseudoalteromonas aliena]|uniref:Uncharacterized protein n=1 Tax=Pseudoalteromonas aliena TaxID=247523 RepID=A0A1Q2H076_9GAMM|nr:hypothetical protein B0W48_13650 [Pseudoalteromonas aliena]
MRDNKVERYLYQFAIILDQFEGLNLTLTVLKISDIEQLNNEIFALLSTRFPYLKIAHLINQIGIRTLSAKKILHHVHKFRCSINYVDPS